jgi:hypothetical protein
MPSEQPASNRLTGCHLDRDDPRLSCDAQRVVPRGEPGDDEEAITLRDGRAVVGGECSGTRREEGDL